MSSWRGRKNTGEHSSYSQNANRLRDKLESRSQTNDEQNSSQKHPPGLKGREIGLWYAQRYQGMRSTEPQEQRLLPGPSVSLPSEQIRKIRQTIENEKTIDSQSSSSRFRSEFQRHNQLGFMELLDSKVSAPVEHQVSAKDEELRDEFFNKSLSSDYVNMLEFRQKLPAYQHKDEIIELIEKHQVILIEGNTGCGKTTQVPQYILDDALINRRGSKTKILCTQPRRIAATSIAERVASERAESLGSSVGYQIRLEKVLPRSQGSINFCTTGVLLKFMEIDPSLGQSISHIIIDEIHERNVPIDVCLALIKQVIQHRKDLKVILMSATLNAESFSQYFNNCPIVHIQGFTFGVQELFLEDVLEETKFDNFNNQRPRKEPVWVQHKNKKQRQSAEEEFEIIVGNYAHSLHGRYSQATIKNLMNPQTETIDVNFIEHLIHHISYNKEPGAILVILPGFTVISKLYESLQKSPQFPDNKFVIHPLHSLLTGSDQRNIFIRPPSGVRKIILATPLAETSITIDDVVYVINAGKMRKPFFDFERSAKVMQDQWITTANETQRKGRAGRVQEGICYHLYTRGRSRSLEPFEQPEILRTRLEELVLTIKVLGIRNVKSFISTFIDVPEDYVIEASITLLQRLGALAENEDLTPLGLHLAQLAIPPQIGKMLLLSSIFSCFDPISSVAAGLSFKSPFYTVMGKEEMCNQAKREFSNDSDQLAVANAFDEWKRSGNGQRSFCFQNFLSHATMTMLDRMKSQFAQSLYQTKFLQTSQCDGADKNQNSDDGNLLRAVICGGLYPNIAYRSVKISRFKRLGVVKTAERSVKVFPSSVNCDDQTVFEPGFLVFHELSKFNNSFFLTESTTKVGPYAILMFGDRVKTNTLNDTHYISVGDIVQFRCDQETAKLIFELREAFNRLLEKKIAEPSPVVWNSADGKLLTVIVELISSGSKNRFEDFD